MSDPTTEQLAAISARAPGIVVSAGAGSGKTRVLVDRYLNRLQDCGVDRLIAVTFTEAAAAEMRDRVRKAISADPAFAPHRGSFDDAVIGTIHSLCLRILRDNAVEAGLDPAFRVLGDDEAQFAVADAVADALEASASGDDQAALPLLEIGEFALRGSLASMVGDREVVRRSFAAMGPDLTAWRAHVRGMVEQLAVAVLQELGPRLSALLDGLAALRPLNPNDPMALNLEEIAGRFGDRASLAPLDLIGLLQPSRPSHKSVFQRFGKSSGQRPNWGGAELETARSTVGGLHDLGEEIVEATALWTEHDDLALEVLWALRTLFDDACGRYETHKASLPALDFVGLETRAVSLLEQHPPIAGGYTAGLTELMVDEFQDTNELQVRLCTLLTGQPGAGSAGPTLFVVGDAKQSIYGFRGADVHAFLGLIERLLGDQPPLPLSRTFRAHDSLVQHLNDFFNSALKYSPTPMLAMEGRGEPPAHSRPHVLILTSPPTDHHGQKLSYADHPRVEAAVLAREVAALLDEAVPVWDRDSGAYRPARPSDVAILLRRFTQVHVFEQALAREGVPTMTRSGTGFYSRQEVLDLVNLLAWLAEPDDQVALAGVLRSPMFAIDDATLVQLHAASRYDLFRALKEPGDGVDSPAAGRCRLAYATLTSLVSLARTRPVDEILQAALIETDLEAAWTAAPGGRQAVANIRKLIELARTLANRSLDEFVGYLRDRREDYGRESQGVYLEEDAVQVMTVHGAKGLEFPIVAIPEAHLPPRSADSVPPVRWRAESGVACKLQKLVGQERWRMTGFYKALHVQDSEDEEHEYWRLLYVAMTRAADYVIISGMEPTDNGSWLASASDAFNVPGSLTALWHHAEPFDRDQYRAPRHPPVPPPTAAAETDVTAPLIERPRVIPIRASTPVTALRETDHAWSDVRGDGLGTLRGSIAHRAIELRCKLDREPDLLALARDLQQFPVPSEALAAVVADVQGYLDGFESSPLRRWVAEGEARFEVPFAFNWSGVPVHGVVDLLLRHQGRWHVIDFKTDAPTADPARVARPYLPQLGLYGLALEAAVGARPSLALYFLRSSELFELPWTDVLTALQRTRERVDSGALLDLAEEPAPAELAE